MAYDQGVWDGLQGLSGRQEEVYDNLRRVLYIIAKNLPRKGMSIKDIAFLHRFIADYESENR